MGMGFELWDLCLQKQALYHLSHMSSQSNYFGDRN
jgi:hypothetical protein